MEEQCPSKKAQISYEKDQTSRADTPYVMLEINVKEMRKSYTIVRKLGATFRQFHATV